MIYILPLFVSFFYEDQTSQCPLTKFEQFSQCSFGETCCQEEKNKKLRMKTEETLFLLFEVPKLQNV